MEVAAELSPHGHGFLVSFLTFLYQLPWWSALMSSSNDTGSAMPVAGRCGQWSC